ncbi:CBS domain-containing protein [Aquibaculum sediminis]|uniref:CBS domain-containing protein n=1 Tax=Aquibaculum sediminis TaxID=3231907 RepID=UPI003452DDB9
MQHRIVPDIVSNQELSILSPETTVREATAVMAERGISAVMVGEPQNLLGIFTERDLVRRVVATERDPAATRLSEVMTAQPYTLRPGDTAAEALQRMRANGFRHLPVLDGSQIVGMVSIRDLFSVVLEEVEDDLRQRDMLLFDTGYGHG